MLPHERFRLVDDDVHLDVPLTLREALLGDLASLGFLGVFFVFFFFGCFWFFCFFGCSLGVFWGVFFFCVFFWAVS